MHTDYQVQISDARQDPAWDAFVAQAPDGHHMQTSMWAGAKAAFSWRAVRVIVTRQGRIVGGAQMLVRPLARVFAVGYVPKGPVIAEEDPALPGLIIEALQRAGRARRVQYLVVQPSNRGEALAQQLLQRGFAPSTLEVAPIATLLIDLRPDSQTMLKAMKSKARCNIRRGIRSGLTVRTGDESDIPTFHRILVQTSQRQDFVPHDQAYFVAMWRAFDAQGCIKLFLTECEGEALSACIVITFGDTLYPKACGWSGAHGECRPNDMLHWGIMQWGKEHGYRYYDFEGIEPEGAAALLRGDPLPSALKHSVTSFKLSFGGTVTLYPIPYDYVCNPILRWGHRRVFLPLTRRPQIRKLLDRVTVQRLRKSRQAADRRAEAGDARED